MEKFVNIPFHELINPAGFACSCGKHHAALPLRYLAVDSGCIRKLPDALKAVGATLPFLVMDENTRNVAGCQAMDILSGVGMPFRLFCFSGTERVLPNDHSVAELEAAFPKECDFILGIGSGVINDLCKMLAHSRGLACGIVATAPSMDGYASNSSAMELSGIKTTVYTTCPSMILCDTEIMRRAPAIMVQSGFGDMVAKVISIADWRIAHLIIGEYYCENIAQLMLSACEKILNHAQGIAAREETAIRCLTEGLILSGIASSFAGVSRPASGMEHTISHLLEMFAMSQGKVPFYHGIQVGYGLRIALALYQYAYDFVPTAEKAAMAHAAFDGSQWEAAMRSTFGQQAEALLRSAAAEQRNSPAVAAEHCAAAVEHWDEIRGIIAEVLSQKQKLEAALDLMRIPGMGTPETIGYSIHDALNAVKFSRDLRSRYIFTSLCWDIGLTRYSDFDEWFMALIGKNGS